MLIFDQLKKNDPQLRAVAALVLAGLGVLLAGLWWVQVVSARDYQANQETQSFRTVRIPAVRGKILDRQGTVLAENRPTYNISLYLDELRKPFGAEYEARVKQRREELKQQAAAQEQKLGRKLTKEERRQFLLTAKAKGELRQAARWCVTSNVVRELSQRLQQPLPLNLTNFERHYQTRLALPFPVLGNADSVQLARFEEQSSHADGVDVEVQSTRAYPFGTSVAHLLGHLQRDDSSAEGEESFFSYRLPDYRGIVGIEAAFDRELRGMAGAKSVQVNNMGYRTMENIWIPAEPGQHVVLTLDYALQQVAEQALQKAPLPPSGGGPVRGAVVVMDVQTGDVLVLASTPSYDPNSYIRGISRAEWQRVTSLGAEKNRATQMHYPPGSIFKTLVGLAALEAGLDPRREVDVPPNPRDPAHGCYILGNRIIRDTAPPGPYNFKRAIMRSSNTYFITQGLQYGPERIVRLAQRALLGEAVGLGTRQEAAGSVPSLRQVGQGWTAGNTANMSIGQAPILVTPLQVAVMTAALANGGTVLKPRLVERIEPQDLLAGDAPQVFPSGQVRAHLGVSPHSLAVLHEAMVAETEDRKEGTGWRAAVPGLRVCGKTGTAQVQDTSNRKTGQITWFASFAPYGKPRYAVVVMVEDGISGGESCAPVAGKIYQAILERDGGQKTDVVASATP